jgi:superkiller protein 3
MVSVEYEEAYRHFIASLKADPNYAPAFTALGVYYSEYASDPNRASRCFQKAFELDPRETDAAFRLTVGFAEEGDWDLVSVIAQRTIDAQGVTLSHGPLTLTNHEYSWPYKARGLVRLVCPRTQSCFLRD